MIPGSANPLLLVSAAEAGGYTIDRSLRFNQGDSAYLSRTPLSAGNSKEWSLSFWVKRGTSTSSDVGLFSTFAGSNPATTAYFNSVSGITFYDYSSSYQFRLLTTQIFLDCSAWYHLVFIVDTTHATASERVRLYVNGSRITVFDNEIYPPQGVDTDWNSTTEHQIGNHATYFSGYLADIYHIDGQALDQYSFGFFDENGIWQPKAYTGSYGTNGFHLPLNNNSTAAALGTDTSGNNNDWTVNNISVAAGADNDSLVDVPTNGTETDTGSGGEVRGNYATLNPLISTSSTLSNGNLDYASTATYQSSYGTIAVRTGKWYCEGTVGSFATDATIGVSSAPFSTTTFVGGSATSRGYEGAAGRIYSGGGFFAYGATYGAGDVIGVAFDAETGKLWFAKNGTWQASGNPATGTNPAVYLSTGIDYLFGVAAGNGGTWSCNFGQRPFAYTAPSGFKALNTANLPAPVVTKPSEYMDVKLYSGNGGTQTITGLEFSPSLVWYKSRNNVGNHALFDVVRGATKRLISNDTAAEDTRSGVTAFNSDGWTEGSFDNQSGYTYVAWTWDAGSSTVTNTDGSITSSVRANPSAGFSIVTWTGNGSLNQTIGHGCGSTPSFIIAKMRTGSTSPNWQVYHQVTGSSRTLYLDTTTTGDTRSNYWGTPSSTTFGVQSYDGVNANGYTYVAYVFAPVAGYSSFGYYTGEVTFFTGSGFTPGPFIYTGFKPRWILIKNISVSSASTNWVIKDSSRPNYDPATGSLYANLADAEDNIISKYIEIHSNGFRIRGINEGINGNGHAHIYAAFAEHPFKYARAR